MATTKELMRQLGDGLITVDEAAQELSGKNISRVDKDAEVDVTEVTTYDDDSLFWVGLANTMGTISDEEYERLVQSAG